MISHICMLTIMMKIDITGILLTLYVLCLHVLCLQVKFREPDIAQFNHAW